MLQNSFVEAYLDKSLQSRPGEIWLDIPGYEDFYQASSHGRIKSVDRVVEHPRLYSQFVKGRILSQSIAKNRNLKTGEPMIDLRVSLSKHGKQHYYNTRRIIYLTFIDAQIDYSKDGFYVINTDGNGLDNRVENLKLVSKSEKQKRVFIRDRQDNYLATADRSLWMKPYGGHTRQKPVKQYCLEGKLLNSYTSITEASRLSGEGEKSIIDVAKGKYKQWNGFIWKYAGCVTD